VGSETINISKVYLALNAIVIVAGGYLFLDVHQTVSLGTIISFWLCIVPPFAALGLYILSIIKRYALGLDAASEQGPRFPKVIFIISSAFMMWYVNPFVRNVEGQWGNFYIALIFGGVVILVAIVGTYQKWNKTFRKLLVGVCFVIVGSFFLFATLLSANFVIDTSELYITQQIVVRAERRFGDPMDSFYVTIADDNGNRIILRTTSTVYRHSRENLDGPIYYVRRNGAFNIPYRRLAVIGDGPGGIDRLRGHR